MLTELFFVLTADAHRVERHPDEHGIGPHTDTATDHTHILTLLQTTPTH